ncbi:hypothetical protein ACOI1H_14720 [Loktanella sp. DJP18]|uniref:hypothetical protein n=1 Tax=Loktanella sp. DJP18 TaxID=3409788 RepID=UPI003BB6C0D1
MVDFSVASRTAFKAKPRAPESPYAHIDRTHFRDQKIMRHSVTVFHTDTRHPTPGLDDRSYRATVMRQDKAEDIRLVFLGQRADDFANGALVEQMEAERQVCCEKQNWDAEEKISAQMRVEGFWKPRKWKDRDGAWRTAWEFFVAQWHFSLNGEDDVITEGAAVGA